jgi:hypothetical protein
MEYIKVENDIWQLADGSLYEGDISGVSGQASKIAKKGYEYNSEYLAKYGWGVKKEAPKKKAATKKKVENKAVKPEDVEDK